MVDEVAQSIRIRESKVRASAKWEPASERIYWDFLSVFVRA